MNIQSAHRLPSRVIRSQFVRHSTSTSLPRVLQPSLWESVIPRALRRSPSTDASSPWPESRIRRFFAHPSTRLIILAVLTGSQAIQLLSIKQEIAEKRRIADAQLDKLRDVIERVMAGETVDVKELLGTGKPEEEEKWKEVLEGMADDRRWLSRSKEAREKRREWMKGQKRLDLNESGKDAGRSMFSVFSWSMPWSGTATQTGTKQETEQKEETEQKVAFY